MIAVALAALGSPVLEGDGEDALGLRAYFLASKQYQAKETVHPQSSFLSSFSSCCCLI